MFLFHNKFSFCITFCVFHSFIKIVPFAIVPLIYLQLIKEQNNTIQKKNQTQNKKPPSWPTSPPLPTVKDRTPKTCRAGQTRTSLLRSITASKRSDNIAGSSDSQPWMLPESQKLFDRQWQRQKQNMLILSARGITC